MASGRMGMRGVRMRLLLHVAERSRVVDCHKHGDHETFSA